MELTSTPSGHRAPSTSSAKVRPVSLRPFAWHWRAGLTFLLAIVGLAAFLFMTLGHGQTVRSAPAPDPAMGEAHLSDTVNSVLEAAKPGEQSLDLPKSSHARAGIVHTKAWSAWANPVSERAANEHARTNQSR